MQTGLLLSGIIPLCGAALVSKIFYDISLTLSSFHSTACRCIPAPYAAEPHWCQP